jgi:hypothetical protein
MLPLMDQLIGDPQVVLLQVAQKLVLYTVPTCPLGGEPETMGAAASALP